jgi:hypothetical protein
MPGTGRALLESLREKINKDPGSLVGNPGFRKYLKVKKGNSSSTRTR